VRNYLLIDLPIRVEAGNIILVAMYNNILMEFTKRGVIYGAII
jgi:hypothetical protein